MSWCSKFWTTQQKPSDDTVLLAMAHLIKRIEVVQKSETDSLLFPRTRVYIGGNRKSDKTGGTILASFSKSTGKVVTLDNVASAVFQRSVIQSMLLNEIMCLKHLNYSRPHF